MKSRNSLIEPVKAWINAACRARVPGGNKEGVLGYVSSRYSAIENDSLRTAPVLESFMTGKV